MSLQRVHYLVLPLGLAAASFLSTSARAQGPIQPRMGETVAGLNTAQLARFVAGKSGFEHILAVGEGLGPIQNDTACNGCHSQPRTGGSSTRFVTRFGKAASGALPFDPLANLGGSLLQALTISPGTCDEVVPPQADVTALRMTPPTFGLGLVEAIADSDIQVREAFPPPGVSGKAHIVQPLEDPLGPARVGRMGWKAQVATLLTFSGDASLNEMGLTNRLVGTENAPNGDTVALAMCDTVPDPEDHPDAFGYDLIDRMTDFQKFLAPPPQTPKAGMQGETLFHAVGCASCHVSTPYITLPTAEPGLANVSIKPYSDFLLHDVGTTLGDGIVQGMGTETEFRTTSLWGISARAASLLLHDGRATGGSPEQNLEMATLAHGGEATASRNAFAALSVADRAKITAFLMSLGRAEFDLENDSDIDEFDWFFLRPLVTGPGASVTPDDAAAVADFDQDGDFDLRDFGNLQRAFTAQ